MKKIKIAHVQLLPLLTGVQNVTISELDGLSEKHYSKTIICQSSGELTLKASKLNISTKLIPDLVREISPVKDFKALISLYKIFKKEEFDIVHTHSSKTGLLGRLAARMAGVPLVIHTVHGFPFSSAKSKIIYMFYVFMEFLGGRLSHKVICLHENDKKICIDKLKLSEDKLVVLPNGVNKNIFHPSDSSSLNLIRSELKLSKDKIIIGMIGRLWEQKNPKAMVDAALSILSSRNDVVFVFVGEGELRASLEAMSDSYSDNIKFLGWRSDTADLLRSFDIFSLPSLWEGMPLAIIEAMATGLPCIVSNIPGNNHLIENGKNGFLFELTNNEDFVNSLLNLIDDEVLRKSMGNYSLELVNKFYDIDSRVNKINTLYINELKCRGEI
ncbi:glycosyltransferase family 4 protein [Vibrio parahaemolyticus]|nr:glycosyltransferase family 4 protein [Vibrio parahaemolyticus]EJI1373927.1 glycosyltransferase family 4 protein [Vibrio parahaemolyticus]